MKPFDLPVVFTSYRVVPSKTYPKCDGESVQAYCDFTKREIHVFTGSSEDVMRAALWHEAIHAILATSGRKELAVDEALVEAVAIAIMRIRLDHPWL